VERAVLTLWVNNAFKNALRTSNVGKHPLHVYLVYVTNQILEAESLRSHQSLTYSKT
jgi:hypothetical protein